MRRAGLIELLRRRQQSGVVIMVMMIVLVVSASYLLLRTMNSANPQIERDQGTYNALNEAKQALLDYATLPAGSTLGQLPWPDILDTIDETTGTDYDGTQDVHCPDTSSSVRPNLGVASRCFGRLPWRTLNMLPPTTAQQDPNGEVPWYAVSANLLDPCFANKLNPAVLNWTYPTVATYNCTTPGQLPHPWLTVRDARGNILSNRVAFVLLMPMGKVGTQNRYLPLSLPRNYLDSVTVLSGCSAPCVAGTYDNGAFSPGNDFIIGTDMAKISGNDPNYLQPYQFNDRVIYVTIDELMAQLQKRALAEARRRLLAFESVAHSGGQRYYPYAATLGSSGACVSGNLKGFLPLSQGSCASTEYLGGSSTPTFPGWFGNASWGNFIYYHAGSSCVLGSNHCSGSGTGYLSVGTGATQRNNIRALLIGSGRPIANVVNQIPAMNTSSFAPSAGRAQTGCCSSNVVDYLDSVSNADGDDIYDAPGSVTSSTYNDQVVVVAP